MAVPFPLTYGGWRGKKNITQRSMRHQSHQNPSGLFPSHSSLPGYPPSLWAQENQALAPPAGIWATSRTHMLAWHIWSERMQSWGIFFFLFILLDKLIISSLSYWGSRSSTVLCLPLPSHPLPTPRILKVPPFPLPHTPMLCHCSPDKRPSGSSHMGPETLIKVGCRHAVCPFIILFSANTRTEREARINSQTDTKQRDRDSNLEASHQKDGVREGECPKWQGP